MSVLFLVLGVAVLFLLVWAFDRRPAVALAISGLLGTLTGVVLAVLGVLT